MTKISIRQSDISKIENSISGISWERLELICNALDCKVSYVVAIAESLQVKSPLTIKTGTG